MKISRVLLSITDIQPWPSNHSVWKPSMHHVHIVHLYCLIDSYLWHSAMFWNLQALYLCHSIHLYKQDPFIASFSFYIYYLAGQYLLISFLLDNYKLNNFFHCWHLSPYKKFNIITIYSYIRIYQTHIYIYNADIQVHVYMSNIYKYKLNLYIIKNNL